MDADDKKIAEEIMALKDTSFFEALLEIKRRIVVDLTKKMMNLQKDKDRGRFACQIMDSIHGIEDFFRLLDHYVNQLKLSNQKEKL